jgi:putative aldouronate transport system permease protein
MQIRRAKGELVIDAVVWAFLILFCFICLYPFWFIIVASFNEGNDMMRGGVYWWPRVFTLQNYEIFFAQTAWLSAIKVSVARTVVGTLFSVFVTSLVSYALSRRNLLHGKTYRMLFVFSMYVSGGLIPFYIVLRLVGLIDTFWVYILPTTLNLYFVLIGINFFRSIPDSLIEAAYLDGATERCIFMRIVLPLSTPFIATLALFAAVGQWNSWLDSVYYVSDKTLRPMAYWMISMMNRTQGSGANQDLSGAISLTALASQSTAVVATVAPILLVYPFLQKYFVQGMMIGSIKE